MKYFMAPYHQIEDGPGGKPLGFTFKKERVTEEQFNAHIDAFFAEQDVTPEQITDGRSKLFEYLNSGKEVSVGDKTLSIKNVKHAKTS